MKSSTGLKLEKVVNYFRKSFVLDVRLDFKYSFKWFCTRCSTKGTIEIAPFVKCCITNKVALGSVTNTLLKSQIFSDRRLWVCRLLCERSLSLLLSYFAKALLIIFVDTLKHFAGWLLLEEFQPIEGLVKYIKLKTGSVHSSFRRAL